MWCSLGEGVKECEVLWCFNEEFWVVVKKVESECISLKFVNEDKE